MVVILAPGNEVRSSYFPQRHMLVHSLVYSFAQCARFFLSWITSIPLLLISLLYLEYHENMKPKIPLLEHSFHLTIVTAGALLFGILFICMFAPYWSTGILGQHRTANVAYFFFVPLWFINLSAWYNRYPRLFSRVKPRNEVQRNMIWILIIVSLLATRNTREAWFDLASGKAKAYDQQMKERREIIVSKQDTIWFDVIQRPPASIFVLDITNDPGHWINRGYNEYFKTEAKILPKDSTNRND
jgi:hypothetical protein